MLPEIAHQTQALKAHADTPPDAYLTDARSINIHHHHNYPTQAPQQQQQQVVRYYADNSAVVHAEVTNGNRYETESSQKTPLDLLIENLWLIALGLGLLVGLVAALLSAIGDFAATVEANPTGGFIVIAVIIGCVLGAIALLKGGRTQ